MKKHYFYGPTGEFLPLEKRLEVKNNQKKFVIGIPKEIAFQEHRVSLVPDSVKMLVHNGHEVLVEDGAGEYARFSNHDYAEVGGEIVNSHVDILARSDIIVKVAPLLMQEIQYMKKNQIVISAVNYYSQSKEYFESLIERNAIAIGFEFIKDNSGRYPVLMAMSEIVGYGVIQLAARYLSDNKISKGYLFGGLPGLNPTEVVIIGAGRVGLFSAKAAKAFGALIKVFDNKIYKLRSIVSELGPDIYTSVLHPEVIIKALKTANVVICALYMNDGELSFLLTEDMVKEMKEGSIIFDVSIDQGGCCETSEITYIDDPIFVKHGVIHYCVPNIASNFPRTAAYALSNFFTPLIIDIADNGGIKEYLRINPYFSQGTYILDEKICHPLIAQHFNFKYTPIQLLLGGF
ncbi:MAG: alanine dehydrogenase [Bacteroidales bacterium]|nr:alanine dehydrogenase [Bacteroidales bacterium]MDI9574992.1 alanine dehydrogenase [Bacteroidota bacterium]MDY0401272.1 alanine dehydrogenase [Bacteroidales bacterium]HHW59127.1 alanine dehydrogenase [Bacteroidales bacterium]HOB77889.1 alanine dehydrogenase [Bacteroidales bacterium]